MFGESKKRYMQLESATLVTHSRRQRTSRWLPRPTRAEGEGKTGVRHTASCSVIFIWRFSKDACPRMAGRSLASTPIASKSIALADDPSSTLVPPTNAFPRRPGGTTWLVEGGDEGTSVEWTNGGGWLTKMERTEWGRVALDVFFELC